MSFCYKYFCLCSFFFYKEYCAASMHRRVYLKILLASYHFYPSMKKRKSNLSSKSIYLKYFIIFPKKSK